MNVSLKKAFNHGIAVREACLSDAFKPGGWIHRHGVIFASPELAPDIQQLWPTAHFVAPIGIISDAPEVLH